MPDLAQPHLVWALDSKTLFVYAVSGLLALAVQTANLRVAAAYKARSHLSPAPFGLLNAVSLFLSMATVFALARAAGVVPRYGMIFLPLVLVGERYVRLLADDAKSRSFHGAGLGGAVAGLLGGAWVTMRGVVQSDDVERVIVSGDVPTLPVSTVFTTTEDWAVSVQLIVFYLVSLAVFFAVHAVLKAVYRSKSEDLKTGRSRELAIAAAAGFIGNACGVALFVFLAKVAGVQPRLAMVGLPLFLITESYVKLLRSDAADRRSHWVGLLSSGAGMAAAAFILMRGAPLH